MTGASAARVSPARRRDPRVWRLVALAVGCLSGAWLGLGPQWPRGRWATLVALAGALAFGGVMIRRPGAPLTALATGWFVVGLLAAGGVAAHHMAWLRDSPLAAMADHRSTVAARIRLSRDPLAVTTAAGQRMWLVDATAVTVQAGATGPVVTVNRPVLVFGFGRAWQGLLPGQAVDVIGRLDPPRPDDTVSAVLDARSPPSAHGRPPWWQRAAAGVRTALAGACSGLPTAPRALVPALVLGVVTPLPVALKDQFRVTGLSHLLAVSGENLAILFAAVVWLVRSIGVARWVRIVALLATLAAFVVIARPSASVLRAAAMGGVTVLALISGRHRKPLPALALAVTVLLLADPVLVRDLGFQLSVAATAGIVVLGRRIADLLSRRLPRRLAVLVAVPTAAQLACTPLLLAGFGQVTPYAIPANLVAGLAVPAATLTGVVVAVLALVAAPLAQPAAHLAALPADWIIDCARWFSALPGAGAAAPGWSWTVAVAGLAGLAAGLARARRSAGSCHS